MAWPLAVNAVRGVNIKMHMEGYRARTCDVLLGPPLQEVVVGYVKVAPKVAVSP